jgi:hypothetical protein
MKRVGEIRERRAERFWDERMKGKAGRELAKDKKELAEDIHLIRAPDSLLRGAAAQVEDEEAEEMDADEADEEEEAMEEELVPEPRAAKERAAKERAPKLKVSSGRSRK